MTIREIENLTESDVQKMDNEKVDVKGFSVYLVDLGEYFGYSALVYKNNHHIYHADDFQLHHTGKSIEECKKWYLETIPQKLFTEEEIAEPLKSSNDYRRKRDFLINYYGMQVDYISHFGTFHNEEERQAILKKTEGMYDNYVGMCWMNDKDFVEKHEKLWETLCDREKHAMENFDYCKSAFLYEMYNHEYGINWQADWDVLSCFCKIDYKDESTSEYLERTNFTDMQKEAYLEAKKEYFKKANNQEVGYDRRNQK